MCRLSISSYCHCLQPCQLYASKDIGFACRVIVVRYHCWYHCYWGSNPGPVAHETALSSFQLWLPDQLTCYFISLIASYIVTSECIIIIASNIWHLYSTNSPLINITYCIFPGSSAGASAGSSAGASEGASAGASAGSSAGASEGASAGASAGSSAGASEGASAGASAAFLTVEGDGYLSMVTVFCSFADKSSGWHCNDSINIADS